MPVGHFAVTCLGKTDRQRSSEADRREHDVLRGEVRSELAVATNALQQRTHQLLGSDLEVRPVRVIEQWMDHVHDPDAVVDRRVEVTPDSLLTTHVGIDDRLAGADRALENVTGHGVQQRLPIRKVSIQRADPHPGCLSDGIACRFATRFEDQTDSAGENAFTIPPCVGPHRAVVNGGRTKTAMIGGYASASGSVQRMGPEPEAEVGRSTFALLAVQGWIVTI